MKTRVSLLLLALGVVIGTDTFVLPAYAEVLEGWVGETVELTFESDRAYDHPHRDARLEVRVSGPGGRAFSVAGFWDGNASWKARFIPPVAGIWTFESTCSDVSNSGLHGRHGLVEAGPARRRDRFSVHGPLRVADSGRYLEHEDGTPFFYLADTAWEITWKSTREQVLDYLGDREEKGFTAVQIVVMSHQILTPDGVRNRYGEPFFLDRDYSKLNPRYFDYLDWIVDEANRRGMLAVLVPLWAYMSEFHKDAGPQRDRWIGEIEALLLARYVGARYAGKRILWIVGGDNDYGERRQKAFWGAFATVLRSASGNRHLTTIHPSGYSASFDFFDSRTPWLDFHMYQSSHVANGKYTWMAAETGYELEPARPIVNGEPVYEDIFHNFWKPGDTTSVDTHRIQDIHVRRAVYESVLAGALGGVAYGANGVWQWSTEDMRGSHNPRRRVLGAIRFPGSRQVGMFRQLMEELQWERFRPAKYRVRDKKGRGYVPVAESDRIIVAYLSDDVSRVTLFMKEHLLRSEWIDPSTGDRMPASVVRNGASLRIVKPPWSDAVWVGYKRRLSELEEGLSRATCAEVRFLPNPASHTRLMHLGTPWETSYALEVYDIGGRSVAKVTGYASAGTSIHPVTLPIAGVYLYRLRVESPMCDRTLTGSIVDTGS